MSEADVLRQAARMAKSGQLNRALQLLNSIPQSAQESGDYFELKGVLEASTRKTKSAELDLERAVSMGKWNAGLLYTLGLVELQRNHPEQALRDLTRSIALGENNPSAWLARGEAYLSLKRPQQAGEAFQAAITLSNRASWTYFAIGTAYESQGDFPKAIQAYRRAAQKGRPWNSRVLIALVRVLLKEGRNDEALRTASMSQGAQQTSAAVHAELGRLFAEAHLYTAAIHAFQAALERDPKSYSLRYNLALSYASEGKYFQAKPLAQGLAEDRPSANSHALLAMIYSHTGKSTAAVRELKIAISISPKVEAYYLDVGRLLLEQGRYGEAKNYFAAGSRLCPTAGCANALVGLGASARMEGQYDLAIKAFHGAIDEAPRDYLGYMYLGDILIRLSKFQEAEDELAKGIALHPESSFVHYMYAYALLREGSPQKVRKAVAQLQEATRLDPRDALAYYRLGQVCTNSKDYGQAITYLKEALALSPNLTEAHYQLGRAYKGLGNDKMASDEFHWVASHSQRLTASDKESFGLLTEFTHYLSK